MLEKRFIKGSDLRKRWAIEDKEHFFRIIRSAHVEISPFRATEKKVIIEGEEWNRIEGRGAVKWILRPHNPRNFMPVTFSSINYYQEGVVIPENFRAFDHDIIQYLDDFYYLLEDAKIVEQNMPELVSLVPSSNKIEVEACIEETLDVEGYIEKRKAEGASKEVIAWELYDPEGPFRFPFRMSHFKIARALGLCSHLNEKNQKKAIQKAGERAIRKGKEMLQQA